MALSYWLPAIGDLDRFKRYTLDERRLIRRKIREMTRELRGKGTMPITGHHGTDRRL